MIATNCWDDGAFDRDASSLRMLGYKLWNIEFIVNYVARSKNERGRLRKSHFSEDEEK